MRKINKIFIIICLVFFNVTVGNIFIFAENITNVSVVVLSPKKDTNSISTTNFEQYLKKQNINIEYINIGTKFSLLELPKNFNLANIKRNFKNYDFFKNGNISFSSNGSFENCTKEGYAKKTVIKKQKETLKTTKVNTAINGILCKTGYNAKENIYIDLKVRHLNEIITLKDGGQKPIMDNYDVSFEVENKNGNYFVIQTGKKINDLILLTISV